MENNSTNFDRIEAYLLGQMPPEVADRFEQEMAADQSLAAEVGQQELEHRAMELLLREELQSQMLQWKAEKEQEEAGTGTGPAAKVIPINTSRRLVFRLAAAASVALLIGFFSRQFFFSPTDYESLAMENFGSSSANMRSDAQNPLSPVYQAMNQKDYPGALAQLDRLPAGYQPLTVLNLRGECHFYLHQYPQSAASYQQILQSGSADGDLREKAEWRLLLSYVADKNQQAKVDSLLERVIAEGGQFAGKAKGLKERIK
jgi:hypothetical protein